MDHGLNVIMQNEKCKMQNYFIGGCQMHVSANTKKVIVFNKEKELIVYLINLFRTVCSESISSRGYMTAAFSGGKTPAGFYRGLAMEKTNFPWEKIHIFLADERFVPPAHKDSNFGMINKALLRDIPIPKENIHPVITSEKKPDNTALKYEEEIIKFFKLKQGQFPAFDFLLLGLGENGHTASLFPGSSVLNEAKRLVSAVYLGENLHDRITITIPVINNGRNIIFLITGERKAEVLMRIITESNPSVPASMIKPVQGILIFVADKNAAKLLPREGIDGMQL